MTVAPASPREAAIPFPAPRVAPATTATLLRRAFRSGSHAMASDASGPTRDTRQVIGEPSGVAGKDDDVGRVGPLVRRRTPPAAPGAVEYRRCVASRSTHEPPTIGVTVRSGDSTRELSTRRARRRSDD